VTKKLTAMLALTAVLAASFSAAALGGCSTSTSTGTTYTIADPTGDWGYPSPYLRYSRGPGYIRGSLCFDTLVWKDENGFVPALAQAWEYIDEDNSYVFHLRDDVTWHDGEAFTADDVAFTVEYVKNNPDPFVTLTGPSGVSDTEVVDEYTIKMYLEQPYAPFLNDVAGSLQMLPQHVWEDVDDPYSFDGPEAVIGTGPYTLADYSKEHGTYLYEAYEDYYLGRPAVDRIIFNKVSEEMAAAVLKQGGADAASIQPELVQEMEASGFTVVRSEYGWNAKLMINHQKEPFSNVDFRRALAYAIDRDALVEITQRGYAVAGSPGMMPPDSPWYNPAMDDMYPYDPDYAVELLEGLGYEHIGDALMADGGQLEVELITQSQAGFDEAGQFVKDALEDIGIAVDFQIMEGSTVDANVEAWDFDLSIYGHGGLYEPSILGRVIAGSGFNSARYTANESLNGLLEDQLYEMDDAQRLDIVQQIQQIYADELPALTLYYPDWYWAHDGHVDMFYTSGGVASGIPIAINKLAFMEYND
jgi:peptide/nickel transport system substrate-binding protein